MKRTKEEKAITLIALIITIIVLLILAVVAIGAVKDSKIITHAQNAATEYNSAKANEVSKLTETDKLLDKYAGNNRLQPLTNKEKEEIIEKGGFPYEEEYLIAGNYDNPDKVVLVSNNIGEEGGECVIILVIDESFSLIYSTKDVTKTKDGKYIPVGQWYWSSDLGSVTGAIEYNGECPIKIEDFNEEEIYNKSYLEKIIASFDN